MRSQEFNSSRNTVRNPKAHYTLFITSIPAYPFVFLLRHTSVLPFQLRGGLPRGLYPHVSAPEPCTNFSSTIAHATCLADLQHLPPPTYISKPQSHLVGSTDHKASRLQFPFTSTFQALSHHHTLKHPPYCLSMRHQLVNRKKKM